MNEYRNTLHKSNLLSRNTSSIKKKDGDDLKMESSHSRNAFMSPKIRLFEKKSFEHTMIRLLLDTQAHTKLSN